METHRPVEWEGTAIRLVVGLGNPGRRYSGTRHNLGFMVLDRLREHYRGPRWRKKGDLLTSHIPLTDIDLILAKPLTFMNLSGPAVAGLARSRCCSGEDLLLVHDDLDLAPGRIRLRAAGSAGGHRGVASVIEFMGTQAIGRIKVGIGRPPEGADPAEYVLEAPTRSEWDLLRPAIERAVEAAVFLAGGGAWQEAMNRFN